MHPMIAVLCFPLSHSEQCWPCFIVRSDTFTFNFQLLFIVVDIITYKYLHVPGTVLQCKLPLLAGFYCQRVRGLTGQRGEGNPRWRTEDREGAPITVTYMLLFAVSAGSPPPLYHSRRLGVVGIKTGCPRYRDSITGFSLGRM